MCVGGGGGGGRGSSYFKIKGCGGNASPSMLILACVLLTGARLTKSNPDGIFLILNAN